MADKVELGSHAYIFIPPNQSNVLVISSHGITRSNQFSLEGADRFLFYSLPGQNLTATLNASLHPPRESVAIPIPPPVQPYTMNDYDLTKYQGYHGQGSESYTDVMQFSDNNNFNVLTVRNRTGLSRFGADEQRRLSVLVTQVKRQYAFINEFRCLFCRGVQTQYVSVMP